MAIESTEKPDRPPTSLSQYCRCILHRPGDLAFLAVQHRASGRFANIPFTVQAEWL